MLDRRGENLNQQPLLVDHLQSVRGRFGSSTIPTRWTSWALWSNITTVPLVTLFSLRTRRTLWPFGTPFPLWARGTGLSPLPL